MRSGLIIIITILTYCVYSSFGFTDTVDIFEFGVNEGRVSFTKSGNIGIFDKIVRVPIVIPHCTKLTFVRVDVDNRIGPPRVTLDLTLNTVVIKYRRLQYSRSSYVVTAKSIPIPDCDNRYNE